MRSGGLESGRNSHSFAVSTRQTEYFAISIHSAGDRAFIAVTCGSGDERKGFALLSQETPQLLAGPMKLALRSSDRAIHHLGDLAVFVALDIVQDEHYLAGHGQLFYRALYMNAVT